MDAKERKDEAAADLAELKAARMRNELIDAAETQAGLVALTSRIKTRLLSVPKLGVQRNAALATPEVVDLYDGLIREALEELANVGANL